MNMVRLKELRDMTEVLQLARGQAWICAPSPCLHAWLSSLPRKSLHLLLEVQTVPTRVNILGESL